MSGEHKQVPFSQKGEKAHLNVARIVEALIIASLAAGGSGMVSSYVSFKILETKLEGVVDRIDDHEEWIRKFRNDFYAPRRGN